MTEKPPIKAIFEPTFESKVIYRLKSIEDLLMLILDRMDQNNDR